VGGWLGNAKGLRIALAIIDVLVLLVGSGLLFLRSGDRAVAYTPDQAIAAFRAPDPAASRGDGAAPVADAAPGAGPAAATVASTAPPAGGAPAAGGAAPAAPAAESAPPPSGPLTRPAAGVYVYKTDGSESIDLLGGATHEYPAETTITLRHNDCGFDTKWQPLEQRAEYRSFCLADQGLRIAVLASQREFFGRVAGYYLECAPDAYYLKYQDGAPANEWTATCTGQQGNSTTLHGKLLGTEQRQVGGQAVDAVKFEVIGTPNADSSRQASSHSIVTMSATTGLVLALDATAHAVVQGPTGSGTYDEHYTLELTDLTPRT
jgi:hypothetical protein